MDNSSPPPSYSESISYTKTSPYPGPDSMHYLRPGDTVQYSTHGQYSDSQNPTGTDPSKSQPSRPAGNCSHDRALCCIAVMMFVGGAGALIALGATRVKPYIEVQHYESGLCKVTISTTLDYNKERRKCSCGKNCHSSFACLRVYVYLTKPDGIQQTTESYLQDNEHSRIETVS